ncbi:MAG: hypothetical protein ACE5FD_04270, partial [Anaerolineae bacterium]
MENFKKNNIWIIITSFVVLLVLVGVIVSISPDKFDIKNSQEGIGFVKDQQEISVFLDRVSFYFNDGIPYKYSLIEYPP